LLSWKSWLSCATIASQKRKTSAGVECEDSRHLIDFANGPMTSVSLERSSSSWIASVGWFKPFFVSKVNYNNSWLDESLTVIVTLQSPIGYSLLVYWISSELID
jgi:hypothetical protein